MRYVLPLLGISGSGKTTLADALAQYDERFRAFSTGRFLRALGEQPLDERGLDPREHAVRTAVRERLQCTDYDVLLLDGFPRTRDQMVWLQRLSIGADWQLIGIVRIRNQLSVENRRARGRDISVAADMAQRVELITMRENLAAFPSLVLKSNNTELHQLTQEVMRWLKDPKSKSSSQTRLPSAGGSNRGTTPTQGLIFP